MKMLLVVLILVILIGNNVGAQQVVDVVKVVDVTGAVGEVDAAGHRWLNVAVTNVSDDIELRHVELFLRDDYGFPQAWYYDWGRLYIDPDAPWPWFVTTNNSGVSFEPGKTWHAKVAYSDTPYCPERIKWVIHVSNPLVTKEVMFEGEWVEDCPDAFRVFFPLAVKHYYEGK